MTAGGLGSAERALSLQRRLPPVRDAPLRSLNGSEGDSRRDRSGEPLGDTARDPRSGGCGDTLGQGEGRRGAAARATGPRAAVQLGGATPGRREGRAVRPVRLSTGGSARRGPVTLRAQDVERLHKALPGPAPTGGGAGFSRRRSGRRCLDERRADTTSRVDHRREDQRPVAGAEQRIDRMLRVRHQAEDVPRGVADAGHVAESSRSGSRRCRSARSDPPRRAPRTAPRSRTSVPLRA